MIMCPDIESQSGLLFSCLFTQHHSESPTRQKRILLFLLKQSLMCRKKRGQKKEKDLTDCTAVSIQLAVVFLKSPALAIILRWGWWGRAADNLLCVYVLWGLGDRGVEHTHTHWATSFVPSVSPLVPRVCSF